MTIFREDTNWLAQKMKPRIMQAIKIYIVTIRHPKVLLISHCVAAREQASHAFLPRNGFLQTGYEATLDPWLVWIPPFALRTAKPDQWLRLWSVTAWQQQAASAGSVWKRDVCRLRIIQGSGQVWVNVSTETPLHLLRPLPDPDPPATLTQGPPAGWPTSSSWANVCVLCAS